MIPVYRKDTGEQVYIPEHWLANPALAGPFTTDPAEPAALAEGVTEDSTIAEMQAYATEHGIDLGGATRKADIYAAITNPTDDDAEES